MYPIKNSLQSWWWNFKWYIKPTRKWAVIVETNNHDMFDEILYKQECVVGWNLNGIGGRSEIIKDLFCGLEYSPQVTKVETLHVRLPVFIKGELLRVNKWGREVSGFERKPDKWYVKCEYYYTLRGALKRLKELRRLDETSE